MKASKTVISVPELVTYFRSDPESMESLVAKVKRGVHRDLSCADLYSIVVKAFNAELRASCDHSLEKSFHEAKAKVLEGFLTTLRNTDLARPDVIDIPESGIEISFPTPLRLLVVNANRLSAVRRFVAALDSHTRASFRMSHTDSPSDDFIHWYYDKVVDFPLLEVVDESDTILVLLTIFQDQQFPSVGSLALGIEPSYDKPELRVAVIEAAIPLASECFRALEVHTIDSDVASIESYECTEFTKVEIPENLPDGLGGFSPKVLLFRRLVTDQEYAGAGD